MRKFLAGAVLGAMLGAAAVYLAVRGASQEQGSQAAANTSAPLSRVAGEEARLPAGRRPEPAVSGPALTTVERARAAPAPAAAATNAAIVSLPATPDIPGGKLGAAGGDTKTLDGLLNAFRAYCQFGPGAGGNWPRGSLFAHTAAWQGGPVNFDTVDLVAGKARMKNDSGLTATQDGELDVRVIATNAGLHFTVIKPDGELMVTTIYAALDAQKRYRAAVSLHGPRFDHETAQFYGYCTL